VTARLVVLASGSGTNFQAIVDACRGADVNSRPALDAAVVGLICDRPEAFVLSRAASADIRAILLPRLDGEARHDYDDRLGDAVAALDPELIVLAGWMRLLSVRFLGRFTDRVINLHPALPGEFPGTHAIARALHAAQHLGLRRTGVMVHYVPDEGVDDGPVIATATVDIRATDSLESLAERVHAAERTVLIEAIRSAITAR
jgi:phosphoribosylglycinamide formyltransferase-1